MLNAEQGNLEEVRQILRTKKNLDINQTNKKGYTALAFGVKSGNASIIRELIAAGADVNIKNSVTISQQLVSLSRFIYHCSLKFSVCFCWR